MTARSLANLILGTLIVAAAALLLFSRSERQTYRQTVSDMNTDIVDRLVVERDDGSELIFNKNKDNWFLIEPVRLRARPARIEAMLALPNTISRERLSATEANLRIMHLSPPLLKLRIGDRIFHFGGIDPIKNRRYVRHGKTIHLIDDRLFHQLTQPIAFFAHIQLLPIDAAITQITYPDHTASLDGGRWQNSPGPLLHGMDTAALVENWRKAEAQRVLPYRKTEASGKIIIKMNGRVVVFDIITANRGLLLARIDLGLQYQLSADTASSLGLSDYLREGSIYTCNL